MTASSTAHTTHTKAGAPGYVDANGAPRACSRPTEPRSADGAAALNAGVPDAGALGDATAAHMSVAPEVLVVFLHSRTPAGPVFKLASTPASPLLPGTRVVLLLRSGAPGGLDGIITDIRRAPGSCLDICVVSSRAAGRTAIVRCPSYHLAAALAYDGWMSDLGRRLCSPTNTSPGGRCAPTRVAIVPALTLPGIGSEPWLRLRDH